MNYLDTAYTVAAPFIVHLNMNPHICKEKYKMIIYFKDQVKMNELTPYPKKDRRNKHTIKENHALQKQILMQELQKEDNNCQPQLLTVLTLGTASYPMLSMLQPDPLKLHLEMPQGILDMDEILIKQQERQRKGITWTITHICEELIKVMSSIPMLFILFVYSLIFYFGLHMEYVLWLKWDF